MTDIIVDLLSVRVPVYARPETGVDVDYFVLAEEEVGAGNQLTVNLYYTADPFMVIGSYIHGVIEPGRTGSGSVYFNMPDREANMLLVGFLEDFETGEVVEQFRYRFSVVPFIEEEPEIEPPPEGIPITTVLAVAGLGILLIGGAYMASKPKSGYEEVEYKKRVYR